MRDESWSIGDLAVEANVTVKTIRFYSDRGLLPEEGRTSGGHRRYGPEARDRLRLIRALRALGLAVPDVARVLETGEAFDDVVAARLGDLEAHLAELRWREAALRLVHDCSAEERTDRLRLIGALSLPPGTDALVRFWRRLLPPRLPDRLVSAVLELAVPPLPEHPTPELALTFARLNAFVSGPCFDAAATGHCRPYRPADGPDIRSDVLYDGLGEAHALVSPHLLAGRAPHPGDALDGFVAAHAASRRLPDTPAFRRVLARQLAVEPRIDRYWELAGELFGPGTPTAGAADTWFRAALDAETAAAGA